MSGSLLLIEVVTHERWVFDSRYFPFVKGCADDLGWETRWLCFGAGVKTEKTGPQSVSQLVELEGESLEALERHVAEVEPTHVLVSHVLAPSTLRRVVKRRPAASLLFTSDHASAAGLRGLRDYQGELLEAAPDRSARLEEALRGQLVGGQVQNWFQGRTDWVLRWLGQSPDGHPGYGRYLVDSVRPSYDAVMANERAVEFKPHLLVLGGLACDHFARVADNPAFAGVDLDSVPHDHGCSYCTWYRGATSDLREDPVRVARDQLARILETTKGRGRFCGTVDILDIRLFSLVDRLVKAATGLGLPPTRFCFEPRVDRVLAASERLEKALRLCASSGHSVYVFRMGAENLVEEENALFNKQLSLEQLDEGRRRIRVLEARHAGVFEADPTWGFITCSPWTTLEMLETGITRAVERGFEPLGVWLYTPLILYREAPITRLARRDGLLATEFDDLALLYEASVNNVSFDSLVPWRFRDERTAAAFGLIVRFSAAALRSKYPDAIFDGDELYERLLAAAPDAGGFLRPDLFALEAIAATKAARVPGDKRSILDAALEAYGLRHVQLPPSASTPAEESRSAPAAVGPDGRDARAESDLQPPPDTQGLAELLRQALERPIARIEARGVAVTIRGLWPADGEDGFVLDLSVAGRSYRLYLGERDTGRPCLFRTDRFNVAHARETPLKRDPDLALVRALVEAAGAGLDGTPLARARPRPGPRGSPGSDPPGRATPNTPGVGGQRP